MLKPTGRYGVAIVIMQMIVVCDDQERMWVSVMSMMLVMIVHVGVMSSRK